MVPVADIPEIPEPPEWPTARMYEEWKRLTIAHHDRKSLERDLADRFVEYLNSQFHLSLDWVCAPDESDRSGRAPDCLYEDKITSLSVVLEITRLYDETRMKCNIQWERYSRCLEGDLRERDQEGQFFLFIPYNLRAPIKNVVPPELVQELKELKPGESVELASLPRVRAHRALDCCQNVTVDVVLSGPLPDFGPKYQKNLKETSDKFRSWHNNGSETFLLYDAREFEALLTSVITQKWQRISHMFKPGYNGEPSQEKYSCIDHVICFTLDADCILVNSLYTHHKCGLPGKLPTEWGIPYPQIRQD